MLIVSYFSMKAYIVGIYCKHLIETVSMFMGRNRKTIYIGPFVQSIVRLTSSLEVKMLTVLVSMISNSQVF